MGHRVDQGTGRRARDANDADHHPAQRPRYRILATSMLPSTRAVLENPKPDHHEIAAHQVSNMEAAASHWIEPSISNPLHTGATTPSPSRLAPSALCLCNVLSRSSSNTNHQGLPYSLPLPFQSNIWFDLSYSVLRHWFLWRRRVTVGHFPALLFPSRSLFSRSSHQTPQSSTSRTHGYRRRHHNGCRKLVVVVIVVLYERVRGWRVDALGREVPTQGAGSTRVARADHPDSCVARCDSIHCHDASIVGCTTSTDIVLACVRNSEAPYEREQAAASVVLWSAGHRQDVRALSFESLASWF